MTLHPSRLASAAVLLLLLLRPVAADEPDPEAVARGSYIFAATSCASCHSVKGEGAQALAGGRALATPFGTFYSPNITPDPEHGLGRWSYEDFRRALTEGLSPSGAPYYPSFPYTSYADMRQEDLRDLWAYLRSRAPVARPNRPHALFLPFDRRWTLYAWRWLFFAPAPLTSASAAEPAMARGAYLVEVLGHCGECHTPRNLLGARRQSKALSGNARGPEGGRVPSLRPDLGGLADWSASDVAYFLKSGLTPEGDAAGGAMAEVIEASTGRLSDADRDAIAAYLFARKPR